MSTEEEVEAPTEVVAVADAVPDEVVAMDGVADNDEAHNLDRPARDSGTKKHKEGEKKTPISELVIGSFVDGTVKTITSYGAFVDIGASTDALLHVSRLSSGFVANVEDIVQAGAAVSVRIVAVDIEKSQVAISMISEEDEAASKASRGGNTRSAGGQRKDRPQRSGGDRSAQVATMNALVEAGFDDSKMIEGQVASVLDFGAFVRFDVSQLVESVVGELDGLVHISALTAGRADSVAAFVSVGDKVQVRIRSLDTEGSKVSLSMISKEDEAANKPKRQGGGGGGGRARQMFSDSEMGAKDWKESLEKFHTASEDTFTNAPVFEEKRKTRA